MTKVLTAIGGKVVAVQPIVDVDNTTIIGMNVTFTMLYKDLVGNIQNVGTAEVFDGWAALSSPQKTNMQDIRNTIVAAITAAFIT
jgi:hypothetical protein